MSQGEGESLMHVSRGGKKKKNREKKMEQTGLGDGEMVREICVFVERRDREVQMAAGFNDIKVNKLPSPSFTVKGGSCLLSGTINSRLPA